VQLVISDQHCGRVTALKWSFECSAHQQCRVHFARNLLAHVPKTHADMVAAAVRTIFAQPDPEAVSHAWGEVRDQPATSFPKVGPLPPLNASTRPRAAGAASSDPRARHKFITPRS
jgi:putative transposase